MNHRLTHIGVCVRDIAVSTAFYCTALGFTKIGDMHVDDEASAQLLDVPGLSLTLVYLERDGFRIELLGYDTPGTSEGPPRRMNTLGLTHLSFRVTDIDGLADTIVAHGGQLLAERTVTFGGGNRAMMLTDPDGNFIELVERVTSQAHD
ncbi:VOC family protein [Mycolicibacterium sp.]|uniref:VOC family protein n=1 Tax=Mycolicibacterium sp. TaxID=2320850 RepID=UPI0037C6D5FA